MFLNQVEDEMDQDEVGKLWGGREEGGGDLVNKEVLMRGEDVIRVK